MKNNPHDTKSRLIKKERENFREKRERERGRVSEKESEELSENKNEEQIILIL